MEYKELLQKINAGEFILSSIAAQKKFVEQDIEDSNTVVTDIEKEKENGGRDKLIDDIVSEIRDGLRDILQELVELLEEIIEDEFEDEDYEEENNDGDEESVVYPEEQPEKQSEQPKGEEEKCDKKEEIDIVEEIDFSKIKWGSLKRWLKQHYGDAAFNSDGTIKKSFVRDLLNNPNVSDKIKRKIRFYLNVLAK